MEKQSKYSLAFTAASLRLNDMVKVAEISLEHGITDLREIRHSKKVFNSGKAQTSDREFREIRKRLEYLTPDQMDILAHGSLVSQKQIAFLAVCKHYDIIRDFAVDVILDKTMVFTYQITESDFTSFINNKIQSHPELETFSESTLKKAKQVLFHILEQAGIINNPVDKIIQPQLLHPTVMKAIADDDPSWLRIFMMSDRDIKQLKF